MNNETRNRNLLMLAAVVALSLLFAALAIYLILTRAGSTADTIFVLVGAPILAYGVFDMVSRRKARGRKS